MTGARYRAMAAALDDGPDLPPGPLAQPSPYSEQYTAALAAIAHRDARIRELEALVERLRKRAFDLAAELTVLKHGKALEKIED
jgi:hypothetical protein